MIIINQSVTGADAVGDAEPHPLRISTHEGPSWRRPRVPSWKSRIALVTGLILVSWSKRCLDTWSYQLYPAQGTCYKRLQDRISGQRIVSMFHFHNGKLTVSRSWRQGVWFCTNTGIPKYSCWLRSWHLLLGQSVYWLPDWSDSPE